MLINKFFTTTFLFLFFLSASLVQAAPPYKEVAVTSGGSVSGKVSFEGKAPKSKFKTINKDTEVCGTGEREYDVTVLGPDGGVADVVVYIEKIAEGKAWEMKEEPYLLEQEKCTFIPQSYVVRNGADLKVMNKDPVTHNIHSYEIAGRARITMFNSSQPAKSEFVKPVKIRRVGDHGLKLECDQHNFMHDWMFVADTPYFSVTLTDGKFEIKDIPAGKYKLAAWHPVLGTKKAEIEVDAGASITNAFIYKK